MRQAAPIATAHRIDLDHTNSDDYHRLVTEELAVIASGRLRPTEVFGIYEKKAARLGGGDA
jgi:hypothetical protein